MWYVLTLLLLSGLAVSQEEVDFSRPPAQGLKFKVVAKSTQESETTFRIGEGEPRTQRTRGEQTHVYVQTYLQVQEGKIRAVEREYEDAAAKLVVEGGRRGGPRTVERESPRAWRRFRVTWDAEGNATVRVQEGEDWVAPERRLARLVSPREFRQPLLPLPEGTRRVGETWELSAEEIRGYVPSLRRPRMGRRGRRRGSGAGEEARPPEADVEARVELVRIEEFKGGPCAVLRLEYRAERDGSTMEVTGTYRYSLKHRIIIGAELEGKSRMERSFERGGRSFAVTAEGSMHARIVVEILAPGETGGN